MIKRSKKQKIQERPIDPTRNAEDLLGDTTGETGITRGSVKQTSAEPDDVDRDTSDFAGGIIKKPKKEAPTGIPQEAVSDKTYNKKTMIGQSEERGNINEEFAEEPDQKAVRTDITEDEIKNIEKDVDFSAGKKKIKNVTEEALREKEEVEGEYSENQSADPESDDDALNQAQEAGFQPDETIEKPEEVDAGRDIDNAEEKIRTG